MIVEKNVKTMELFFFLVVFVVIGAMNAGLKYRRYYLEGFFRSKIVSRE